MHNRTKKNYYYNNYLDSIALIKNCPNILRAFKKTLAKKSFSFSTLFSTCNLMLYTSFMSLNAFLWILSYILQLKIIWISSCFSFFLQFLEIFISSWKLYHLVVFIAKLLDDNLILVIAFLLLNLCKLRYLSFLKSSFVCKKSCSFHFCKRKGGFGCCNTIITTWTV